MARGKRGRETEGEDRVVPLHFHNITISELRSPLVVLYWKWMGPIVRKPYESPRKLCNNQKDIHQLIFIVLFLCGFSILVLLSFDPSYEYMIDDDVVNSPWIAAGNGISLTYVTSPTPVYGSYATAIASSMVGARI